MLKFKHALVFTLCLSLLMPTVACTNTADDDLSHQSTESNYPTSEDSDGSSAEESDNTPSNYSSDDTSTDFSTGDNSIDQTTDTSTDQSVDISGEDSSSLDSGDGSSEDTSPSETRFSPIAPEMEYNKVWESGKMELYNTDYRISDELLQRLEKRFLSFTNAQSVALIELDTNMAFFYSKDTKIATASAIKGPMALFAYKCIDDGVIGWDTEKKYQPRHYQANSTGNIKNYPYGTSFTVKKIMDNMIRISDNQAYLMMKELVGASNFEQMMASLGSTQIIPNGSNWGYITAKEMASVWREIYFYSLASDSGAELFDRFMHAQYNYIWRSIKYETAHKSGWSGKAYNDAGVVFCEDHQYVLVALMGRSGLEDKRSQAQFNAITKMLAEVMLEYNAYLDEGTEVSSEDSVAQE